MTPSYVSTCLFPTNLPLLNMSGPITSLHGFLKPTTRTSYQVGCSRTDKKSTNHKVWVFGFRFLRRRLASNSIDIFVNNIFIITTFSNISNIKKRNIVSLASLAFLFLVEWQEQLFRSKQRSATILAILPSIKHLKQYKKLNFKLRSKDDKHHIKQLEVFQIIFGTDFRNNLLTQSICLHWDCQFNWSRL